MVLLCAVVQVLVQRHLHSNSAKMEARLIALWKERTVLYDISDQNFRNKQMKDQGREEIANELGITGK